ncbi:MAG: nicotinamide riboside transporter PnuC [Variovorax sp.]|jgi:nicotinamide mononucleotide transporter|nr:MAG: nicotinamide riboside transporter PnuC [Variovorax sp.]
MPEFLSAPAFMLWGTPATWLELTAALLALVMVGCNMREIHWGWPLAIASSLLYFGVFSQARIYGDASLQIFFALVAFWGWLQWLRGHRGDGGPLRVMRLSPRGIAWTLAACAFAWPAVSLFLHRFTDTDVPWWDGFATGLSLVGQFLLGRKFIENWLVWIAVNVVSIGLFIHKGLWLTVGLYAVFAILSVAGYVAWRQRLPLREPAAAGVPTA